MTPSIESVFKGLGLDALGAVTMTLRIKPDYGEMTWHVPVTDMSKGIFAMHDPRPSSLDLRVPFVNPTAYGYAVSRVDLAALFRELPAIIKSTMPPAAPYVDMGLNSAEAFLGIRLATDLLAHLDTQLVSVSAMVDGEAAGLLALRLNNAAAIQDTLAKIFSEEGSLMKMLSEIVDREEFLGTALYVFSSAMRDAADAMDTPQQPDHALAVDGGYLFYGPSAAVKSAIRSVRQPEQDHAFYQSWKMRKLRELAPAEVFQYSVYDWSEMLLSLFDDAMYENIRTALEEMTRETSREHPWSRLLEDLDFTHWPSRRHVASFFGPSFDYSYADASGFYSKTFFFHEKNR